MNTSAVIECEALDSLELDKLDVILSLGSYSRGGAAVVFPPQSTLDTAFFLFACMT